MQVVYLGGDPGNNNSTARGAVRQERKGEWEGGKERERERELERDRDREEEEREVKDVLSIQWPLWATDTQSPWKALGWYYIEHTQSYLKDKDAGHLFNNIFSVID